MVDHIPLCYIKGYEYYHADFVKLVRGIGSKYSREEKVKLEVCRECKLGRYCYGIRKDYIHLFGKNIKVYPYNTNGEE